MVEASSESPRAPMAERQVCSRVVAGAPSCPSAFDRNSHPLIRKLVSIAPVSDEEGQAILALPMQVRDLKTDQDIVRDHDRPSQCCLILEGFACRYKILPGGKRQIFSFHISGDIPDLQSLHIEVMDHAIATIVASKVAFIPHETVRAFIRAHPRIGDVFWRDTLRPWLAARCPAREGPRPGC
jgi:CRP-like cAMP-binding protein